MHDQFCLFINTGSNVQFGKQQIVSKYMKGICHLRPSLHKYTFTWDIRNLLDYYRSQSNNNELDLDNNPTDTTLALTSSDSLFIRSKVHKSRRR